MTEDASVIELHGLCFTCKHSMVILVARPAMSISAITHQREDKHIPVFEAVCVRWNAPMITCTESLESSAPPATTVQSCTEWEPGAAKQMKPIPIEDMKPTQIQ